jgi:serine/threonine protein phosphatase PrpC
VIGIAHEQIVLGPFRVLPGRLSVSRTFGDIEGKLEKYGGLEGVIIAEPEISKFTLKPDFHDFIVLGCDGIFDRLSNQQVLDVTWDTIN